MGISPEEFMRAALAAGATVEYAEGTIYATPRNEVVVVGSPPPLIAEPDLTKVQPPKERVSYSNDAYPIMKKACSPWTTSHIAHISSALAVMHGARTGEWVTPGVDALIKLMPKVDMPTLIGCVQRAGRFKHANKVDGRRMTMSTGAVAAAMYDAMQVDSNLNRVEDLEPLMASQKMLDTTLGIANSAEMMGGSRSIEFRKQTYAACLQVFTKIK